MIALADDSTDTDALLIVPPPTCFLSQQYFLSPCYDPVPFAKQLKPAVGFPAVNRFPCFLQPACAYVSGGNELRNVGFYVLKGRTVKNIDITDAQGSVLYAHEFDYRKADRIRPLRSPGRKKSAFFSIHKRGNFQAEIFGAVKKIKEDDVGKAVCISLSVLRRNVYRR